MTADAEREALMRIRARSPRQVAIWRFFDLPSWQVAVHAGFTAYLIFLVASGFCDWLTRYQAAQWKIAFADPVARSYAYYPYSWLEVEVYQAGRFYNAHIDIKFPAPLPEYSPFASYRVGMRPATPQEVALWRQYFGPRVTELRSFPSN